MMLHPEPVHPRCRPCRVKVTLLLVALTLGLGAESPPTERPAPPRAAATAVASPAPAAKPAGEVPRPGAGAGVFADPALLHAVKVVIPREEWDVLVRDTYVIRGNGMSGVDSMEDDITREDGRRVHIGGGFGGYFPWVHADLTVGGRTLRDVAFRYKGNGSYSHEAGMHRSIKVKTDFFDGKGDWDGLKTLNFNSGGRDPSRTREALAFAIFRMAGVPAPRTAYAEVRYTVPGLHPEAFGGLFTVIENVNKAFLRQALPPGTGLLMKPERMNGGVGYYGENWAGYTAIYRPEREATPAEAQRVIDFARLVNLAPVAEFRAKIGSYLDVDGFMRFLAVHALIHGRDSYLSGRHNYFIYLDPSDNRFRFIPWDEDGVMGGGGGGRGGMSQGVFGMDLMAPWSSSNPLAEGLLEDPVMRARYQDIVRDLVAKVFNEAALTPLVDRLEAVVDLPLVKEEAAMASRGEFENRGRGGAGFGGGASRTPREFLEERYYQVRQQISGWSRFP